MTKFKENEVDELKHSISVLFVTAMDRLGSGAITFDEFNNLVDLVGKVGPDDNHQRGFYDAVKLLAEELANAAARRKRNEA